jgi:hypothetical protein
LTTWDFQDGGRQLEPDLVGPAGTLFFLHVAYYRFIILTRKTSVFFGLPFLGQLLDKELKN